MPKEMTPEEVYEELSVKGLYEEANLDKDEIIKIITITLEDFEFGKRLRNIEKPNYRILFNINYDVLRELCDQLMRFKEQKTSNHKGLFAFIMLNFPELEFDWDFFEKIRNIRNQNKYKGTDITKDKWAEVSLQIDIYVSTIRKEINSRLKLL